MAVYRADNPPQKALFEKRQESIDTAQPNTGPRRGTLHDNHAPHSPTQDLQAFLGDGFDLPADEALGCQNHFDDAFMSCTQSAMESPDMTGQDEAFLLGNFQSPGSDCAIAIGGPGLGDSPRQSDRVFLTNPVLDTAVNGTATGISSYTCLLRGAITSVQPRNMMFTQECTFMSTKKLLETAIGAKIPTQFPMIQLYARVVYSRRENFVRQQYFQLSDLTEAGGLLSASLSGWETGGMLDVNAAELLGEWPYGIKCFIRGRLVQNAQAALGLVMDIQDIRYAAWAEIKLMNDTLDIGDPMIPPL